MLAPPRQTSEDAPNSGTLTPYTPCTPPPTLITDLPPRSSNSNDHSQFNTSLCSYDRRALMTIASNSIIRPPAPRRLSGFQDVLLRNPSLQWGVDETFSDLLRHSMEEKSAKEIAQVLLAPEPETGRETLDVEIEQAPVQPLGEVREKDKNGEWNVFNALKAMGVKIGPRIESITTLSSSANDSKGRSDYAEIQSEGEVLFNWSSLDAQPPILVDFANPFKGTIDFNRPISRANATDSGSDAGVESDTAVKLHPTRRPTTRAICVFQSFPNATTRSAALTASPGLGVKIVRPRNGSVSSISSDMSTWGSERASSLGRDYSTLRDSISSSVSTHASFSSSVKFISGSSGSASDNASWRKAPLNPTALPFTSPAPYAPPIEQATPSLPMPRTKPLLPPPSSLPARPGPIAPVFVKKESAVLPQPMSLPSVKPMGMAWEGDEVVSGNELRRRSIVGMDGEIVRTGRTSGPSPVGNPAPTRPALIAPTSSRSSASLLTPGGSASRPRARAISVSQPLQATHVVGTGGSLDQRPQRLVALGQSLRARHSVSPSRG